MPGYIVILAEQKLMILGFTDGFRRDMMNGDELGLEVISIGYTHYL